MGWVTYLQSPAKPTPWGTLCAVGQLSTGMKAHTISLSVAALIAAFGAGCANTTTPDGHVSNQTKGAAAGAATGAILGGVLGNNGPHGNTEKGAAIGAVAGGIAGGVMGRRADERQGTVATSRGVYSPDAGYSVQSIPPAPVSEPQENPPPQPSANAVWIRGHYTYTGSGYQWESGRWEVAPPGARTYVQPAWQPAANGGYVYVRGHWQ